MRGPRLTKANVEARRLWKIYHRFDSPGLVSHYEDFLGRYRKTRVHCSCALCGHRRRWDGPTLREKKLLQEPIEAQLEAMSVLEMALRMEADGVLFVSEEEHCFVGAKDHRRGTGELHFWINCNDVFCPAAYAYDITQDQIPELFALWKEGDQGALLEWVGLKIGDVPYAWKKRTCTGENYE